MLAANSYSALVRLSGGVPLVMLVRLALGKKLQAIQPSSGALYLCGHRRCWRASWRELAGGCPALVTTFIGRRSAIVLPLETAVAAVDTFSSHR